MVFRWKIVRPPFQAASEGVQVMHPSIETEFETGSISEAHGIFSDSATMLGQMFGAEVMGSASALAGSVGEAGEVSGAPAVEERRRRGPNKSKVEAIAPAPLPIPDAPPIAPAMPPVPPLAAPVAVAPPSGVLAGKIIAELERRATGAPDGGQALADWLATSGITVKGATYAEAVDCLRLISDEKLGPVAQALSVAA